MFSTKRGTPKGKRIYGHTGNKIGRPCGTPEIVSYMREMTRQSSSDKTDKEKKGPWQRGAETLALLSAEAGARNGLPGSIEKSGA